MKYRAIFFGILLIVLLFLFWVSVTFVISQIEESHMMTAKLHLITAIESIEKSTDSFFENEAIRVSDWSSDGNIRTTTENILAGKKELGKALGDYIRTKKMPLDKFVLDAEVIDEQGHLIASTIEETGMEMNTNHLAPYNPDDISKLKFGEHAFSFPIFEGHHGVSEQLMIHFIAPLFSPNDETRRTGFLVIHVRLDSFFQSLESENITTTFGNPKLYLFDQTGKIYLPKEDATLSKEEMDSILASCKTSKQKDEGFIRESQTKNGSGIIGAIVCTRDGWWVTYLASDTGAIMSTFTQGRNKIIMVLSFFFLFTIFVYAVIELDTSRKIRGIVKVLGEVSKGNLKSRVDIRSSFFSEIIRSINSTVEALEKTSQEERELEKLYRALTDSSPISIKLFNQDGKVVFLNKRARTELGLSENEDLSNFDVFERIDPRDRDIFKKKLDSTLANGTQNELEYRHIPGRGSEYCHGIFTPVAGTVDRHNGIIFSSIDITERKKAEEKIGSLEQVKKEFASIAAHQIRAPITAILALSAELEDESKVLPEKVREIVKMIKESVRKQNDFITFLLSVTHFESGVTKFNLTSFDLKAVTEEVIATLRESIDSKGIAVEIGSVPNELPHVYTDREVVRQVIQNFITNAIRYSQIHGKISVQMKLVGNKIEYSVKDEGIGIPAAVQTRIFSRFFRADNAQKASTEGIGLGLSFSKSLVESWGGEIWFESEEGKGSTFHMTIPIIGTEKLKSQIFPV